MKTVLITGASGGIGRSVALEFAKNDYFVIAFYNSDNISIENLKKEFLSNGFKDRIVCFKADFNDKESLISTLGEVKKAFKSVDVIVNCAGVALFKQINDTTIDDFQKLLNINTTATFIVNNAFIEEMISRKSGKIINVSSIWGVVGASCEVAYSASKGALVSYTKGLAKELGLSGITVNCVCPGVIDTKMNSRLNKQDILDIENETPLNRIGKAEEVAYLIYFLASDKADFITGQVITIDGGFTL